MSWYCEVNPDHNDCFNECLICDIVKLQTQLAQMTAERDAAKEKLSKFAKFTAYEVGFGDGVAEGCDQYAKVCSELQAAREEIERLTEQAHDAAQRQADAVGEALAIQAGEIERLKEELDHKSVELAKAYRDVSTHLHIATKYDNRYWELRSDSDALKSDLAVLSEAVIRSHGEVCDYCNIENDIDNGICQPCLPCCQCEACGIAHKALKEIEQTDYR